MDCTPGLSGAGPAAPPARSTRSATGSSRPGGQGCRITWETTGASSCRAHAAELLDFRWPLAALGAAAALVEATLPEREPNGEVFEAFVTLLDRLATLQWAPAYARFEVTLLAALGFGLDLTCCAVTGKTEDLAFVSPRTGRAVSRDAAGVYENRLFVLPSFLIDRGESADPAEVAAALRLTGHFFARQALAPAEREMPSARTRLYDSMVRLPPRPNAENP